MSAEVTTDRREWKKKHLLTPHNVGKSRKIMMLETNYYLTKSTFGDAYL